jgi:ribosomal protein L29
MAARKKKEASANSELEAAKLEAMRIRFRRVLGETVPAHTIKQVRKNVAKCVMSGELRGKNG